MSDRTQAEIDADVQALRETLISVITENTAYRIRGLARVLHVHPAHAFNMILTDVAPMLDVTIAAVQFTEQPSEATTRELRYAVQALTQRAGSVKGLFDIQRPVD